MRSWACACSACTTRTCFCACSPRPAYTCVPAPSASSDANSSPTMSPRGACWPRGKRRGEAPGWVWRVRQVGTARCAVPARVQRAERWHAQGSSVPRLNGAGTPQRSVPTSHAEEGTAFRRRSWRSDVVSAGGDDPAAAGPVGVEELAAGFVHAFVGVRAEIIALRLEEIGRQDGGAILVVERQGGAEGGHGDPPL